MMTTDVENVEKNADMTLMAVMLRSELFVTEGVVSL